MEQLTVERSILIAAPRERVWQAVTDPAEIAQWLLPPALGAQLKRDAQGALLVCLGPMEIPFARVDIVETLGTVHTQSLPDKLLTTVYRLEEEPGGTRVTVTIAGFDRLPADTRQDFLGPTGASWEKALANLKAFIAGAALPFPGARGGPASSIGGVAAQVRHTVVCTRNFSDVLSRQRRYTHVIRSVNLPCKHFPRSRHRRHRHRFKLELWLEIERWRNCQIARSRTKARYLGLTALRPRGANRCVRLRWI